MTTTDRTHQKFLDNLSNSLPAVWDVAKWLQSIGYAVTVNPTLKAPEHEQWKDYADHGDLVIQQRIEVKHLSRNFTGVADWPFGRDFIVCAKHSFDRAKPKPYAYIVVSADSKSFGIVYASTSERWTVKWRSDVRYGDDYQQEFYLCPIELVKWGRLK